MLDVFVGLHTTNHFRELTAHQLFVGFAEGVQWFPHPGAILEHQVTIHIDGFVIDANGQNREELPKVCFGADVFIQETTTAEPVNEDVRFFVCHLSSRLGIQPAVIDILNLFFHRGCRDLHINDSAADVLRGIGHRFGGGTHNCTAAPDIQELSQGSE